MKMAKPIPQSGGNKVNNLKYTIMKRIILLFILICPLLASAETIEINGLYYNLDLNTKKAEVTRNPAMSDNQASYYSENITIPETVTFDGILYDVTSIEDNSFQGCTQMTTLSIPNSITKIGSSAFSGCNNLTTINIPPSVNDIGSGAFAGCYGLESITVDNGNKVYDSRNNCNAIIETKSNTLFCGCKNTIIPYGIQGIAGAFQGCKGLTSVDIPNTVNYIFSNSFSGCSDLSAINLPNSILSIGDFAFAKCSNLSSIEIPNTVTSIGAYAFEQCKSLSKLSIPKSVTHIGDWAFYACHSLTDVILPSNLTEIHSCSFSYCINLLSVSIPQSVTKIYSGAFDGCHVLSDVYCYAENVPNTEDYVFKLSSSDNNTTLHVPQSSIDSYKSKDPWWGFGSIVALTDEDQTRYNNEIPIINDSGIEGVYQTESDSYRTSDSGDMAYGMPYDVLIFDNGDGTYYVDDLLGGWYNQRAGYGKNYKMRGTITISSDGVISLNDSFVPGWGDSLIGFTGSYDEITSTFTIEAEYVNGMKFYQTWKKTGPMIKYNGINYKIGEDKTVSVISNKEDYSGDIVIPNEVLYNDISYKVASLGIAFQFCEGLKSVNIPQSVTSIDAAFSGCKGLTDVTIPNSVSSIGNFAFSNCSSLSSLSIPNSVSSIGNGAFQECSSLSSLSIPSSVTVIGDMAFSYCTSLSDLILPESITMIGESSFIECKSLKSLVIPKNVLSIGTYSFNDCDGLETIIVDRDNAKFDSRNNCNAIIETYTNNLIQGCKTTVIPNDVVTIGGGAFSGMSNLIKIDIPNNVRYILNGAFYGCKGLENISIGSGVELIGNGAFGECDGLKYVIIPNKVNTIDPRAFYACNNLKDVYCYAEKIPSTDYDAFNETPIENATLHVPAASVETYKQTIPWSSFGHIIPLSDDDPQPTGINSKAFVSKDYPEGFYSLNGSKLKKTLRGINIIRMNDGSTRKVLIK